MIHRQSRETDMEKLEGYSVAKDGARGYRVFRNDTYVAYISHMGELFGNRIAFDWHDKLMWNFRATDFVKA